MRLYADVIVDISKGKLDRTFQYAVPDELDGRIFPGVAADVPFGRGGRIARGYVVGVSHEPKIDPSLIKEIRGIAKNSFTVESQLIALAAWMKTNYGGTMIQALKTVMPVKKKTAGGRARYVRLELDEVQAEALLEEFERKHMSARARLLSALIKNPLLPYSTVTGQLGVSPSVIRAMSEKGIVSVIEERSWRNPLPEMVRSGKTVELTLRQKAVANSILEGQRSGDRRPCLIRGATGSGKTEIYMELIRAAAAEGKQSIVLIPEIALTFQTVSRFYNYFGDRVSVLNSRMSAGERSDQFERASLGETDVIIGPRSALFTPFPNLGFIIIDEEHESSYKSENVPRYDARETAIERACISGACVVMGSATPSVESYKKASDGEYRLFELNERPGGKPMPAVSVADMRKELERGNRSILSDNLREKIEDRLEKKEQVMLFLNRRGVAGFVCCRTCGTVIKCPHCDVTLTLHGGAGSAANKAAGENKADAGREAACEKKAGGAAWEDASENKAYSTQQRAVPEGRSGIKEEKPGRLICHYCGYVRPMPKVCPVCSSPHIGGFKAGTQKVEEYIKREFPGARTLRMDMDTTRKKNGHEQIARAFAAHEADILIGTQMIVKGHDFKDVTLVGALAADMSLNIPDYRASERTFQLLEQAAGRAGRGDRPGEAVIQTYNPEHYSILAAVSHDYKAFYQQEIAFRSLMRYPPVWHLLTVHFLGPDKEMLDDAAVILKNEIESVINNKIKEGRQSEDGGSRNGNFDPESRPARMNDAIYEDGCKRDVRFGGNPVIIKKDTGSSQGGKPAAQIIGPADEAISKVNDIYRKVIYIKGPDKDELISVKDALEERAVSDKRFDDIILQFDMQ